MNALVPDTAFLSLGANLGDRLLMLQQAVDGLRLIEGVRMRQSSSVYETLPWGLIEQPKFLNIVAEIETVLAPLELLRAVKALETRLGREPGQRWGPRSIDIDLVLWGAMILRTTALTLPHAHFRERAFVLIPLAEIAPNAVDPETGATATALAKAADANGLTLFRRSLDS